MFPACPPAWRADSNAAAPTSTLQAFLELSEQCAQRCFARSAAAETPAELRRVLKGLKEFIHAEFGDDMGSKAAAYMSRLAGQVECLVDGMDNTIRNLKGRQPSDQVRLVQAAGQRVSTITGRAAVGSQAKRMVTTRYGQAAARKRMAAPG